MNDYNFGNFLFMLRTKNGLTQADVANKLGVTPAAVSKWENGSSKPRVEVLFQLAQLLGVKTEELMSGQYIQTESIDHDAVKKINERYNYLVRVDSCNSSSVKWRRLLAWIIDWNLIGFSVIFILSIVSTVVTAILKFDTQRVNQVLMFAFLLYPTCFILRDLIFGGRSVGKRILGLIVLDKQTGQQAKAGRCALRNIFLFIAHIDVIFMLVSGITLGDRAAHTVVVKKDLYNKNGSMHEISEINHYLPPKKTSTKKVCLIIVSAVVLLLSIILICLSEVKKTEAYNVAFNYLVESHAFDDLDGDSSKILTNKYSLTSHGASGKDEITQTVQIGFLVEGKSFVVTCHKKNEKWSVCDECTKFK